MRFDGVKQGQGTKKNFITREIARLPLQFNINVRAPFYSLISKAKSIYDPSLIQDPRAAGLLDERGQPIPQAKRIQPQASEHQP